MKTVFAALALSFVAGPVAAQSWETIIVGGSRVVAIDNQSRQGPTTLRRASFVIVSPITDDAIGDYLVAQFDFNCEAELIRNRSITAYLNGSTSRYPIDTVTWEPVHLNLDKEIMLNSACWLEPDPTAQVFRSHAAFAAWGREAGLAWAKEHGGGFLPFSADFLPY